MRVGILSLLSLFLLGFMLPFPTAQVYRSGDSVETFERVIVIGDTQDFVGPGSGTGSDGGRLNQLIDIRDYLIANPPALVVTAGDNIDSGTPLPFTGCDGWSSPPDPDPGAACFAEADLSACVATVGCGWTTQATPPCAPCNLVPAADSEWVTFKTLFVDPLTAAGIPVVITTGNHDNLGLQSGVAGREPLGIDVDRFNVAYYQGLEGTLAYDHVASNDLGVDGIGHAFDIAIGSLDTRVVSVPYIAGQGVSAAHQTWVSTQCAAAPSRAIIVLAHHVGQVAANIQDVSETSCPNLIMVIGGHTHLPQKQFAVDGSNSVLEVEVDYSSATFPDTNSIVQEEYIGEVRLYLNEIPTAIEALDFSVQGNAYTAEPSVTIGKQAFDFSPPVVGIDWDNPYDLTPFESRLAEMYDGNGIARPTWPSQPNLTSTCTTTPGASAAASLAACVTSGAHVQILDGFYDVGGTTGGNVTGIGGLSISANDVWLDAGPGVTIRGSIQVNADRVRLSGFDLEGRTTNSSAFNLIGDDILAYNINASGYGTHNRDSFNTCFGGNSCNRIALVNVTCVVSRHCIITPQGLSAGISVTMRDLIVANMDAHSLYVAADDTGPVAPNNNDGPDGESWGNDESALRIMSTERALVVDSHFRTNPTNKSSSRIHYGALGLAYLDNTFECTPGAFCGWIDTSAGSADEVADINHVYYDGNTFNLIGGTSADLTIDDSNVGDGDDVLAVTFRNNTCLDPSGVTCFVNNNSSATVVETGNSGGVGTGLIPFTGGADH